MDPSQVRGHGIYRGVLQPETSALIPGVPHPGPSLGRPPRPPGRRSSITTSKNTKYCSAFLTQPNQTLAHHVLHICNWPRRIHNQIIDRISGTHPRRILPPTQLIADPLPANKISRIPLTNLIRISTLKPRPRHRDRLGARQKPLHRWLSHAHHSSNRSLRLTAPTQSHNTSPVVHICHRAAITRLSCSHSLNPNTHSSHHPYLLHQLYRRTIAAAIVGAGTSART